jgi:putative redox protein
LERGNGGRIDRFERVISVDGEISEELRDKIAEIAGKCPVHRTLEAVAKVRTVVRSERQATES